MKSNKAGYIVKVGLFSSIAFIISMFEFPLFFLPGFYKLDLSESIILMASFSLGPVGGVLSELVKTILLIMLKGTTTACIGELANFVIGLSLILPASAIYKKKRTFRGAVIGMVVGIIVFVMFSCIINYFILFGLYTKIYAIPESAFISMAQVCNSQITDIKSMIIFATLPFNAIKGVSSCLVSTLLYKRLSKTINKVSEE